METIDESRKSHSPARSASSSPKLIGLRSQFEHMLHNAVLMTEIAMDLKDKCNAGEKYMCYLRSLSIRGSKTMSAMQGLMKGYLLLTQRLTGGAISSIETAYFDDQLCHNMKVEFEKLHSLVERELTEFEDIENQENSSCVNLNNLIEKIKFLETKQKTDSSYLPPTNSARSFKSDVDEKYPENWSRESLIDLNNVVNLPSVPEDIFGYATKPIRTSSLSSLKSIRKVKLYLQRAGSGSDDDEEASESEEHDISKLMVVSLHAELSQSVEFCYCLLRQFRDNTKCGVFWVYLQLLVDY